MHRILYMDYNAYDTMHRMNCMEHNAWNPIADSYELNCSYLPKSMIIHELFILWLMLDFWGNYSATMIAQKSCVNSYQGTKKCILN